MDLTIGEVVEQAGVTVRTLGYYEEFRDPFGHRWLLNQPSA